VVLAAVLFGTVFLAPAQAKDYFNWEEYFYGKEPAGQQTGQAAVRDTSPVIDLLDLKAVDIHDVLKLISQKSGFNIMAGQGVRGPVTVYLTDIRALKALRMIVEAYGWAYAWEGKTIRIMTRQAFRQERGHPYGAEMQSRIVSLRHVPVADMLAVLNQIKGAHGRIIGNPQSNTLILKDTPERIAEMAAVIRRMDIALQTEVYELNYAKAGAMADQVSAVLTPELGRLRFDERSNTLVVTDTRTRLDQVRTLVAAFDQKDQGVLIEAKMVQVALTDEHKMGVDWEALVADHHHLSLVGDLDVLGSTEKRGRISIGKVGEDRYRFLMEALDEIGRTDILSSPRITTVNNQEAKILVGMTEPYVTTTTTTPESGPPTISESVNFIEVGVKLNVTPTIHKDGFITMKIRPEVSSVVDNLTTSNNNTIPVVETSEAETTVIVKDRATVVIGGLMKEEAITASKQIPGLSAIPVLGRAFQNQRDYVKKTEIVIFMTPRIVKGDSR
jgi:type II secretory pathway component GspD/PulD (secretin)